MNKPVSEMTVEECYYFKALLKRQRPTGSGPERAQFRHYKQQMMAALNRRLRQLGAPIRVPGDTQVYGPGSARWQGA